MLDISWDETPVFDLHKVQVKDWLSSVCVDEGFELHELSIVFLNDLALLEMNKKFLSHGYFTDIITFDYTEDHQVSGDLFISVDRVKDNAKGLSLDWREELNRVMVHGVLHLIGYGDKSEDDASVMRGKEDFYLNKLKGFT